MIWQKVTKILEKWVACSKPGFFLWSRGQRSLEPPGCLILEDLQTLRIPTNKKLELWTHNITGYMHFLSFLGGYMYFSSFKTILRQRTIWEKILKSGKILRNHRPDMFQFHLLTLLLIDHCKTIQNFHFQKCPLVLYTHGDTIWTVLVASYTMIQMVLEGPVIHHLEVSKHGFVLAVLQFEKIQTRFCISWPTCTIQNHLGNQHCTVISPFKTTIANGFKWCINLYEKGTKSRRVYSL